MKKYFLIILASSLLNGCYTANTTSTLQAIITPDLIQLSYFVISDGLITLKANGDQEKMILESTDPGIHYLKITICKGGVLLPDDKYEKFKKNLDEQKVILKSSSKNVEKGNPLSELTPEERIKLIDTMFSETVNMPKIGKRAVVHSGFTPNSNQNIIFTTTDGAYDLEIEAPAYSKNDTWGIVDVERLAELISTKYDKQ